MCARAEEEKLKTKTANKLQTKTANKWEEEEEEDEERKKERKKNQKHSPKRTTTTKKNERIQTKKQNTHTQKRWSELHSRLWVFPAPERAINSSQK